MRLYISAPITGQEATAEQRFAEAEAELISLGHIPLNPYRENKGFTNWGDAILSDLRLLKHCDGLVQLEGWEHSRGCRIEADFASGINIPIYKL